MRNVMTETQFNMMDAMNACINVLKAAIYVTKETAYQNVNLGFLLMARNAYLFVEILILQMQKNVMTATQFNLMDAMNASINVLKAAIYVTKETAYQNVNLGFLLMARNAYLFVEILILQIQKNVMMATNLKMMDVIIA
ncbi:unnamed protein product [Paramecium pentaurelia]|uniref:Uncharacterized protein n=1 Tax=Paramecium pentaurelia TaxID=43138 RepID=A0A8S1WPJ5_9CILI|nr:unnamed protein product [Paramecium pentaurelia]